MSRTHRVQQGSASALSAGYSPAVRRFEIASIFVYSVAMLWLLSRFAAGLDETPWLALTALGLAYVAADFISGVVHWAADTWGTPHWPVAGRALIRPFREHHVDPKAITRHDFVETNGNNCAISIPAAVGVALLPQGPQETGNFFGAVFTFGMLFFVFLTNQFHKWAHMDEPPRLVAFLQRWHLVLPRDHHDVHHHSPFEKYYCITVGWMNEPLYRVRFFRILEWIIAACTGLVPREDDIGRRAALKLMDDEAKREPKSDVLAKLPPA
jgi:ubiquitin-conjugating enzyme E2 variant